MKKSDINGLVAFPLILLAGLLGALAGGQVGSSVFGLPLFALLVGIAFLVQWLVFIPSYLRRTEKFFDLAGSLTFICLIVLTIIFSPAVDARSILLASLVVAWAARLGSFLFARIQKAGKDDRFEDIKSSFIRFLNAWTMQGLWVAFTAAPALVAITTKTRKGFDFFAVAGLLLWLVGFALEVVADSQKARFSANPENRGRFIRAGLWGWSRHPNHLGEILLWVGVAVIAAPVLQGWQWIAVLSPVFIGWLLTRVSGIPILEKKADQKWGGQADYESYKARTPMLIPRIK